MKATDFGEITQTTRQLRRSRSFKLTDFDTNRKLVCDFLLVINTNLPPILHRSKLWPIIGQICGIDRVVPFNALAGGDPLRISG